MAAAAPDHTIGDMVKMASAALRYSFDLVNELETLSSRLYPFPIVNPKPLNEIPNVRLTFGLKSGRWREICRNRASLAV
jgi:hypothetical protein